MGTGTCADRSTIAAELSCLCPNFVKNKAVLAVLPESLDRHSPRALARANSTPSTNRAALRMPHPLKLQQFATLSLESLGNKRDHELFARIARANQCPPPSPKIYPLR